MSKSQSCEQLTVDQSDHDIMDRRNQNTSVAPSSTFFPTQKRSPLAPKKQSTYSPRRSLFHSGPYSHVQFQLLYYYNITCHFGKSQPLLHVREISSVSFKPTH